jgi:beta-glucosidase
VQVYLRDLASTLKRPAQELVAFAKLALAPGERRSARFELPPRALAYWHPQKGEGGRGD